MERKLKLFAEEKEQQARALAAEFQTNAAPEIWDFYKSAKAGAWQRATNQYHRLRTRSGADEGGQPHPSVHGPVWPTVLEVGLAIEMYLSLGPHFTELLTRDLTNGIPTGSVYLGGTDPGRALPTAFCASHVRGDPFFTFTQNHFTDWQSLTCFKQLYEGRLNVLTLEDSQRCFNEYYEDAGRRAKHDRDFPNAPRQLRPGEDVRWDGDRLDVRGQVAVMTLNGLMAKSLFDKNPDREFFVEESFPLEWMYPHLTPHTGILKINRHQLDRIPPDVIERDRAFWKQRCGQLLGVWLKADTTVKELCDFVERTYVRRDTTGFTGDRQFLTNWHARAAYSKLRVAQGGVYFWRINQSATIPEEQDRMIAESDFAFRQAYAMSPSSAEALFRYTNLLISRANVEAQRGNRRNCLEFMDDAILLAETSLRVEPRMTAVTELLKNLKAMRKQFEK